MITIDPATKLSMVVANNLRRLRTDKGWSQEMLAHLADLHPTAVSRIERGERHPQLTTCGKLAAALGCTLDELATEGTS